MHTGTVKNRKAPATQGSGVYADLEELVRLQFKAKGFSFLPRQPVHSILSGRHASRLRGRGLNFEELRGYLPGDDIRTIDWRVTARTREPHVRVYTEEKDRSVWLLVDQRQPMFFGSRTRMKSVLAAEAAALSAWRVLESGDRVGGVVMSDHGLEIVPAHRSQANVHRLLSEVVKANHRLHAQQENRQEAGRLNQALDAVANLAPHDSLVVLITDGSGINAETRKKFSRLTEHNDVMVVLTFDEMEREFKDGGRLAFSDGAGQVEINTADSRMRSGWQEDFNQRLKKLDAVTRKYQVPVLALSTARPTVEQVREQLGRRAGSRQ